MKAKQLAAVALASLMALVPVLSQAQRNIGPVRADPDSVLHPAPSLTGLLSGSGEPMLTGSGAPVVAGANYATGGAVGMTHATAGTVGTIAVVSTLVVAGAAKNQGGATGSR